LVPEGFLRRLGRRSAAAAVLAAAVSLGRVIQG
jgi:hypothetical protein